MTTVLPVVGCVLILLRVSSAGIFDKIGQRNEITPSVKISQGELTGLFQTSTAGKKYMAFYGIPYAKPPLGDLRFKAPQPAAAWEGVRPAHTEGDMCIQPKGANGMKPQASVKTAADALKMVASLPGAARMAARYLMHVSEDCLKLTVYSPVETLPVDRLLPVLVFIHGGGFLYGSGDYNLLGPEHLMDREVVLVTMNYRLGPFGFLSTNSSDAPGNAGLKDQRMALQWVQDNIRHFGGDPDKVTIYGNSAGSVSAHLHVLSPQSKGLFQNAILSSGVAQDPRTLQSDSDAATRKLAAAMGAGQDTVSDVTRRIQFLRDAPAKDIVAGMKVMRAEKNPRAVGQTWYWAPVVEPADSGETPFLERHPNAILQSGEFNTDVALMIGVNDKEGSVMVREMNEDDMTRMQANPTLLLTPDVHEAVDANTREALADKVQALYLKGKPISTETIDSIADVFGDEMIGHGTHVATHWHLKHAVAPVFLYYFTLDAFGAMSFLYGTSKSLKGAGHEDDLGYVFKNHLVSDMGTSDKDRFDVGVARMTTLVANFISQRNPSPSTTEVIPTVWTPATMDKPCYLEIGDNLTLTENVILPERMQFWDGTMKEIFSDPIYELK